MYVLDSFFLRVAIANVLHNCVPHCVVGAPILTGAPLFGRYSFGVISTQLPAAISGTNECGTSHYHGQKVSRTCTAHNPSVRTFLHRKDKLQTDANML